MLKQRHDKWKDITEELRGGDVGNGKTYNFWPYEKAEEFVHGLGLRSQRDWNLYYKSGNKPDCIPSAPYEVYKEWGNWGQWLGTGVVAPQNIQFRSYEECKIFANFNGIKTQKEWNRYDKPNGIPSTPQGTYLNKGWTTWGDFLDTNNRKNTEWLSYGECKKIVKYFRIKSQTEWSFVKIYKKYPFVPSSPQKVYSKNGEWEGWGDFLGTNRQCNQNREYVSYEKCKELANALKIKNQIEWRIYSKSGNRPNDIPGEPYKTYRNEGWTSWADFLNTKNYKNKEFLPYKECQKLVKTLEIANQPEWREYSRSGNRPANIPGNPYNVYRNKGWESWPKFLGTE